MKHRRKAEVRNSFLQQFDNLPKHSIVTVSDRLWMCLLCRAALDGEHAVLQHLGTAKHRKQQIAQEAGLVDGTGGGDHVLGEEEVGNFNGAPLSASATIGKARSGKQTCGSGGDMFACEECAICCNSKEMLNVHLKSAKHKRKVEGVGIDLTMRCEICQVSCCGAANYAAHLKGKLHAKTIRRNEEAKNDKDLCETGINV